MALSAALSVAAIIYVVMRLDWRTVRDTYAHLNWIWLAAALFIFMINYILRTLRFQALIYTRPVPFLGMMEVTCLHGMLNYLMPAKTGEFSYLLLLNRRLRIPVTESTATLLVARFFDFATIAVFLPTVVLTLWDRLPTGMAYAALAFCGAILALGVGSVWLLRRRSATGRSIPGNDQTRNPWLNRLIKMWHDLLNGLRLIDRRRQYWRFLLLTVGMWLCVYTKSYLIVLSMGYHPTYFQMIAVSLIMVPLTLLPVQGIANLGTHEAGWVAAFSLFGHSQDVSLAIAASSHVIVLSFVLVIGLVGTLGSLGAQSHSSSRE